jgi:ABC-type multidrug transport system ATPase subunit
MSTPIVPTHSHAVQCRGISFHCHGRSLFQDLSFTLAPGSCTALIGPNGVGKTTLLRILSGLVPYSGEIWLFLAGRSPPASPWCRNISRSPSTSL